jgi:hypothetical protein
VGIPCPFCSGQHEGFHLGFNEQKQFFNCYRCGFHKTLDVISALTGAGTSEAKKLLRKYSGGAFSMSSPTRIERKHKERISIVKRGVSFPPGTNRMLPRHKRYLASRDFDPEKLEKEWGLMGTGPMGPYALRIIAPITYKRRRVSYQGRDITNRSKLRYKACPKKSEIVEHQFLLYGYDEAKASNKVVITEGITDVWRFGYGAVATFGQTITAEQFDLMLEWDELFIMFDEDAQDPEAIGSKLALRGKKVEWITDLGVDDPALVSDKNAEAFMREIGIR